MGKAIKILLGPVLGLLIGYLLYTNTKDIRMGSMAGIATWMAVWWLTEALEIYITALLPISLFPVLGIMGMKDVAPLYTNEIIFLFIGGFLIAFAIEKWNLHKRIALGIILAIGSSPARILFGFMLVVYLTSWWISNTATTMMMLPAALALGTQFERNKSGFMTTPLLLGLSYAASIGGTATLVGTVPNMIFYGFFENEFPNSGVITFSRWFMFGVPMSAMMFIGCYFILKKMFVSKFKDVSIDLHAIRVEYQALGKITKEEKILIGVFLIVVVLWFTRADLVLGSFKIKGWINLFPEGYHITDGTVAMAISSLLFIVPTKRQDGFMLTWNEAKKTPIGILFLFGGGYALAQGVEVSGLAGWMSTQLESVTTLPLWALMLGTIVFMVFLSEFTSNVAATYLTLPIMLAFSKEANIAAIQLMLPLVIASSYAFMLPIATPPSTIVFGSERLAAHDMARAGFFLNLLGIVVILISIWTFGSWIFGF